MKAHELEKVILHHMPGPSDAEHFESPTGNVIYDYTLSNKTLHLYPCVHPPTVPEPIASEGQSSDS